MNEHRSIINLRSYSFFVFLLSLVTINSMRGQNQLDLYIKEGIGHNKGILQQEFIFEQSLYALKEAKSLFFPSLSVGANYTNAKGGRKIEIPVGDLLNPVYSSLNQLTNSQTFSNLDNISQQLNPSNFYDARIRLSMPIFNSEIFYNRRIMKEMHNAQEIEVMLFKRELVKDIKVAYFQYCQSTHAIEIFKNGIELAEENRRINVLLFENGKINYTSVLRAENELKEMQKKVFEAEQTQKNAAAYFNFLLNKPLDSPIVIEKLLSVEDTDLVLNESIINREEIKKLKHALNISQSNEQMKRSYFLPKIGTFIDLGLQNEDWKMNRNSRYYMFGLSLEWIFSLGGGDQHRSKQAKASVNAIESQLDYAKQQLEMQLFTANNSYLQAVNNYAVMTKQSAAIKKYYTDISKQYKEGQALYIELLEAQNRYVNTQLELNIAMYDIHMKLAERERANASFNLSK